MSDNTVDVSQERIAEIYSELTPIDITLDPDPLEFGPDRIAFKFHEIDKSLQRVSQLELQLAEDVHKLWKAANLERLIIKTKRNELMISDAQVRKEKTKGEREARADLILAKDVESLDKIDSQVNDLERLQDVVKTKKKDLKDTERRLRDQMKMVSESIRMGMNWGRSAFMGTTGHVPEVEKDLDEELAEIMR